MEHTYLPHNVQKNIAEFLKPIHKSCHIRIQQNAGCPHGTHHRTEICDNCRNYTNSNTVSILLKKGGDRKAFEKYVSLIKKDFDNKEGICKNNYNDWHGYDSLGPPWKIKHLFDGSRKWNGLTKLCKWEQKDFECKYVFTGLHYAFFRFLLDEFEHFNKYIPNYNVSRPNLDYTQTVISSSLYVDVFYEEYKKNPLCLVNKIFFKYSS